MSRVWKTLAVFWCGILPCGCASLPFDLDIPRVPLEERQAVLGEYKDYRGIIHCHSSLSHDSPGEIADIIDAANATALDFVVMTDHLTPRVLTEGVRGWRGTTFFLLGGEISKARGSLLGLGLRQFVERKGKRAQEIIDALKDQGALAFIAYPEQFREWEVEGYDGVEIYNLRSEIRDESTLALVLSALFLPPRLAFARVIDRPTEKLALWDQLSQRRRVVGVAGTNAHDNVRILGRTFGSYRQLFQLFTNHILARDLTEDELLGALRAGRVYVAFDLFGYVPFFTFWAEDGQRSALMGEEIPLSAHLRGYVRLPATATVHVVKDGRVWKKEDAAALHFPIDAAGVYRIEVYRKGKPWIFSNPVYVVA